MSLQPEGSGEPRGGSPVNRLLERLRAGDQRAVARLISWVEDGDRDQLRDAAEALNPGTGGAQVLGLTGSPGVG